MHVRTGMMGILICSKSRVYSYHSILRRRLILAAYPLLEMPTMLANQGTRHLASVSRFADRTHGKTWRQVRAQNHSQCNVRPSSALFRTPDRIGCFYSLASRT